METKNKTDKSENNNEPVENFSPQNRDFQRTEEDIDNVSKSEKDELEERKKRTHFASSRPDKNHIG